MIRFVKSVRPSVCPTVRMEQLGFQWTDFHGILYFHEILYFREIVYFHEILYFREILYFHEILYFREILYFHEILYLGVSRKYVLENQSFIKT